DVWRTSRIQEGRDCGARLTAAHVIPAAPLADLRRTGQLTLRHPDGMFAKDACSKRHF
ncbi:hypothetical protein AVEN_107138-1, partial [Araneus ventricosus]